MPGKRVMRMAKEFAKGFYRSKLWQDKRREILRRDLYTCEICGGRASEVHHEVELTPDNIDDPSVTLNNNLLRSLCGDCHKAITLNRIDCAEEFVFDENGQLTPRGVDEMFAAPRDREGPTKYHA